MTSLATRRKWKKDFEDLATACNISVGANGRCQRDAVELTDQMYSRFQVSNLSLALALALAPALLYSSYSLNPHASRAPCALTSRRSGRRSLCSI